MSHLTSTFKRFFALPAFASLIVMSATSCDQVSSIGASPAPQVGVSINGLVHGGQQPVAGATIQLYAAGTGATDGSTATALLSPPVTSDASGSFSITSLYHCPTGSQVYLVATGGNPGLGTGRQNTNLAMMAALGPCANLTASTYIFVDEVTTVASVSALIQFMKSVTALGSGASDGKQLIDAFLTVNELASTITGTSPGPTLLPGAAAPTAALYSLSDAVAACINSEGGTSGDGSPCGFLFLYATPPAGPAPTDTIGALINIFNNPTRNVAQIFSIIPSSGPFQPTLSSAPANWALVVSPAVTVAVSPKTPTVVPGVTQQFTAVVTHAIESSVQWQVNGVVGGNSTVGTISATGLYTAPATNPTAQNITITAVANADPTVSDTATVLVQPNVIVTVTPTPSTVLTGQAQQFTAVVSSPNQQTIFPANVTWSLTGAACPSACGTISSTGNYTAPSSVPANPSATVVATSVIDTRQTGTAAVTIAAPVITLTLTPASTSITIKKKTTQNFTAQVLNDSTNSGVTWKLTCVTDGYDGTGETPDCVSTGTVDTDGEIDNSYLSAITTTSVTVNALPNFSGTLSTNTVLTLTATTVAKNSGVAVSKSVTINVTN